MREADQGHQDLPVWLRELVSESRDVTGVRAVAAVLDVLARALLRSPRAVWEAMPALAEGERQQPPGSLEKQADYLLRLHRDVALDERRRVAAAMALERAGACLRARCHHR